MNLKKLVKSWQKTTLEEIKSHPKAYIILSIVLVLTFLVRTYRLSDLLGFYYDQGRDALVIWRLWHEGKLFLVGPVTGLEGIFLGPLYYYLIAPFYLIGGGNPVYPAVFLSFIATSAIYFVYLIGWKFHSRETGIIASIISGFSHYLILAGRWLSNPTPILLTSVLLLLSMWKLLKNKNKRLWIVIALILGVSMQFESASAIFYLPMIFVYFLWISRFTKKEKSKILPDVKISFYSIGIFLMTLVPQILFNLRHDNLLFNNFLKQFGGNSGFSLNIFQILSVRLKYFWNVFSSKIFPNKYIFAPLFYGTSLLGLYHQFKKKSKEIILMLIFLAVPMVGFILFQGNHGNIYDYYMTGYYLIMIILFSLGLGIIYKNTLGKLVVFWFIMAFMISNFSLTKGYLNSSLGGPTGVSLGNQLQAIDYILEDGQKNDYQFNIHVYVPPVIPYSYDYLFLWQMNKKCGLNNCGFLQGEDSEHIYALYEEDPEHPYRLENWLSKQDETSKVQYEVKYNSISVQKRIRFK